MALLMTTPSINRKSQTTDETSPDGRHRNRHLGGQNWLSGLVVNFHFPFQMFTALTPEESDIRVLMHCP
jgi:hypothetical protein